MPKASIVVPCYNAQDYLEETLASAQAQTVSDIEIICVDDGSTDSTPDILRQRASADSRIRVLSQENSGEGPARDAGLVAATGEWVYFLDADDLMDPTLLAEAIAQGEQTDSDIVIFQTTMLDDQTGEHRPCEWAFKRDWAVSDTFSPREYPGHIFNSFQNWVHNKLFSNAFLQSHDLHMQRVHRTADLLFTCRALAEARRITLIDKSLHLYRINNVHSAMSTSDLYPLDFYKAFLALRTSLEEHGLWELYRDSFVNWAIEGIAVNLRFAKTYDTYRAIASELQQGGFDRLGITEFPREKSDLPFYYDQIRPLVEGSSEETLFRIAKSYRDEHGGAETAASHARMRIEELEETARRSEAALAESREALMSSDDVIKEQRQRIEELESVLESVTGSASFKAGRAITFLPRHARDLAYTAKHLIGRSRQKNR